MAISMAQRQALMRVALGLDPADLIVCGGTVANVLSGELHAADLLLKDGLIAGLALPSEDRLRPSAPTLDATGCILVPGLIDPHMHMESSSVTPLEFARSVVPRGVTTVVIDPHEFGNVVGLEGVRALLNAARGLPLRVLLRVPARVPELPVNLETPGATISFQETTEMLSWPEAVCLAGDINPEIIIRQDPDQLQRMEATIAAGKVVSGYVPQVGSAKLDAMIAAGVGDSHVPKTIEELLSNIRHGLHVLLTPRPGRFEADQFEKLGRLVAARAIDHRRISLCTDDVLVHELLSDGHLDARLRMALAAGVPTVAAIQMATRNTAELLQLDDMLGALVPGQVADIAIVSDIDRFIVERVLFAGRLVAENGRYLAESAPLNLPDTFRNTIACTSPERAEDLALPALNGEASVRCRVLVNTHPKTLTERILPVRDGIIQPDAARGIMAAAVLERYHRSGRIGRGFIEGFSLKRGAIASSINHNCHHIFAEGTNFEDMRLALERLIAVQGGYVAAADGVVKAVFSLPIIGMVSHLPAAELAQEIERFERVLANELGCSVLRRPLYTLNFLCSPVVMNYGLTDLGLVDSANLVLVETELDSAEAV
jgi:adenine deaminase